MEGVVNNLHKVAFTLTSDQEPIHFAIFSKMSKPNNVFSPLRGTSLVKDGLQYISGKNHGHIDMYKYPIYSKA